MKTQKMLDGHSGSIVEDAFGTVMVCYIDFNSGKTKIKGPAMIMANRQHCLNDTYVNADGMQVLSSMSIAGNVNGKHKTVEAAITRFNKDSAEFTVCSYTFIRKLTDAEQLAFDKGKRWTR